MATNTSNGSPYKGLQPYTEADREYFFGRERDTEVIASNLYIAPLTILYGTSGVGKSSVLQAGVIPHSRENPRVTAFVFNNWQGENFHAELKQQLLDAVSADTGKPESALLSEISHTLASKEVIDPRRLPMDELITACAVAFRRRILIIFDQFEEYFLYHSPTAGTEGFDAEFARAVNQSETRVNFMISMREEELSKLDRFRPRIPNLLGNLLRLENLDGEAANTAIREPLRVHNEHYRADSMTIEDELVTSIIEQVRPNYVSRAAGSLATSNEPRIQAIDRIETPFLQLVLIRLWEAERQKRSRVLRLSTFEELGGALEIARTHLDKMMSQLSEFQCATAAAVLRFLVTPTGSKIALDLASLASFANEKEADVLGVLALLSSGKEMRILRKVTAAGQPDRYELFHDVLGPAILDWRSRYVHGQQIIQERAQAEKEFSLERQRRLRQAVAALVVLLTAMAATTVYAFRKSSEAEHQRSEAQRQYDDAQRERLEALRQRKFAEDALKDANIARNELQQEKERVVAAKGESDKQKLVAEANEKKALDLQKLESAARQTAETERQRATEQKTRAENLVLISEYNLKGFDAARLGNVEESINSFSEARNLSHRQNNASGEVYALVNMADGYATKGYAIPSELLDLFDNYEETDYDELENNYQFQSYISTLERVIKEQISILPDQARAIENYRTAIEIEQGQKEPDLKKVGWFQQRVGDVQLSSLIVSTASSTAARDDTPDFTEIIKSYNEASDSYARAHLRLEEGILQTRIAFLNILIEEFDERDRGTNHWEDAIAAYKRALSAFESAAASSPRARALQAVTLTRLGETYRDPSTGRTKDLVAAIQYFSKAAEIYGKLEKRQEEGETYSKTAALYSALSPPDREKAFQSYSKAVFAFRAAESYLRPASKPSTQTDNASTQIDKQRDDLRKRVLDLMTPISDLYTSAPKPQTDLAQYFKSVVAIYSDETMKANLLKTMANIFDSKLKDKTTAVEFYREESQVRKQSNDFLNQANALINIGKLYGDLNDRTNLKASFEEAKSIYRDSFDNATNDVRYTISSNLMSVAKTYADLGERKLALETYYQALLLYEKHYDTSTSSRVNDIVQAAAKVVTEADARDFVDKVTTFYRNEHDESRSASSFELAGDLYASWGKLPEAIDYYNRGLAIRPTTFSQLPNIGKLYFQSSNEPGAKKFFEAAIASYRARNYQSGEVNALNSIAGFYLQSDRIPEAINYFAQTVEAACKQKNAYVQQNALRSLSNIFNKRGDSVEAARLSALAADPKEVSNCDFQIKRIQ